MSRTRSPLRLLQLLARDRRGVFATIFAIMIPVVAGILALAIETGIWYSIKRHNQAVADIAAYSGALDLSDGGTTAQVIAAAKNDANRNLTTTSAANTTTNVAVTTSSGSLIGPDTVTVTVSQQQTPLLVSYFLGKNAVTIANHAVAQVVQNRDCCVSGVNNNNNNPFLFVGSLFGSSTLSMPDCTITSNSTSSDSIYFGSFAGSAGITAYSVYTAGGINGGCSSTGLTLSVPATCHQPKLVDPYAGVAVPASLATFAMPTLPSTATTFPTLPTAPTSPTAQSVTVPAAPASQTKPGSGCSNATTVTGTPSACYNNAVTIPSAVTFAAGTSYYFSNSVTINSGVTVTFGNNSRSI